MKDRSYLEIDGQALKHNYEQLLVKSHGSKIMAIVKDQFYGLGLDAIIYLQELGCDFFAVSTLDEAIELRRIGIDQKILILGYTDPDRFNELITYDIEQTVISQSFSKLMVEFGKKQSPLKGQIKLNTAMNRLGLKIDTVEQLEVIKELYTNPFIDITGTYSHLLASDEYTQEALSMNDYQISEYDRVLDYLHENQITVGHTHLYNSYGILNYGQHAYEYTRPGLIFAGTPDDPDFKNVLSLYARVAMVKTVNAHAQIGYGIDNKTEKECRIATVTVGYGDGLSRATHKTNFKYKYKEHYLTPVGRMCMDQLMVDVSAVDDIKENDYIEIIGEGHDIYQLAKELDTIPNEVLTHFMPRLPKLLQF